jgi:hypothetical protein
MTDRHDAPTEPLPALPWDTPPPAQPRRDTPRQPLQAVAPPRNDAPAASAAPAVSSPAPSASPDTGSPSATAASKPARAPISKPSPLIVIGGSFGLFFLVTALLGFQMRAGADPAIGAGEPLQVAAATPPPRKVLVRRVIVTRIVEHKRDDGAPARASSSAPAPSAPARSAPAPAPAAPAPAPAAPAPPPMTTQSS